MCACAGFSSAWGKMGATHPKTHRTLFLCSHPPRCQKERGSRRCLRTNLPGQGRGRGERKVNSPPRPLGSPRPPRVTRKQRRAPRGCSRASLAFRARSPGALRASEQDARSGGLCIQGRSPRATRPFVQRRGGRFAVSGQLPLAPPRRCPLSSSVSGPPRCFLLPSSLLEEARLP